MGQDGSRGVRRSSGWVRGGQDRSEGVRGGQGASDAPSSCLMLTLSAGRLSGSAFTPRTQSTDAGPPAGCPEMPRPQRSVRRKLVAGLKCSSF